MLSHHSIVRRTPEFLKLSPGLYFVVYLYDTLIENIRWMYKIDKHCSHRDKSYYYLPTPAFIGSAGIFM